MKLLPESYRTQFEDTFRWLDKRPCARRRGLGTPFPFDNGWIVESLSDSTIYMVLYTISNIINSNKLNAKQLNQDFFDYVLLGKGNLAKVSKDTNVKSTVLKKCRDSFLYWMPVDLRHTYPLHLSNHLSFMIFAFAGIFPQELWPKKIMSKSKGNVITLLDVKKRYGADVSRLYLTSASNLDGVLDWKDSEAEHVGDALTKVFDTVSQVIKGRSKGKIEGLYVSKFNRIIKDATNFLENMKLRDYANLAIHDMLRLVKDAKLSLNVKEIGVLYDLIAENWIKMLAPVCPHVAEELWVKLGKKGFASTSTWPSFDEKKINDALEMVEKQVDTTVSDVLNLISLLGNKGTEVNKVYLYVIPPELKYYSAKAIGTRVGREVLVFANNDKNKYDPTTKSSKAKPGRPAIYLE
jgi:leucyl-tRNA synthetase